MTRAFRLPEAHWAAISTLVVTPSSLGAAWTISVQRFVGTALGAAGAILLATYLGSTTLVFAAGVFALGLICGGLRLGHAAYRFLDRSVSSVPRSVPWNRDWPGDNRALAGAKTAQCRSIGLLFHLIDRHAPVDARNLTNRVASSIVWAPPTNPKPKPRHLIYRGKSVEADRPSGCRSDEA